MHRLPRLTSALLLAVLLPACESEQPHTDRSITIWWAQWDPADGLQELGKVFEQETGIAVNVHQIPWGSYQDQVFLNFGNKQTDFDIVIGDSQWIGRGATKGLYLELTDWLPEAVDISTIHPRAARYLCEYPAGSGKFFAAPCETDAIGFVYRKDWFEDAAEKMGVDAMRWLYSRQHPATNLNFGYQSTDEVRRQFMIPLWNIYSFFVTYAKIDGYNPYKYTFPEENTRPELDQWIISELNQLIEATTLALESYDSEKATLLIETFVDYLSNWYVRRSRRRFWKSGELDSSNQDNNFDKICAYTTLYECLVTTCKLIAPIMPHLSEAIYQNLVHGEKGVNKRDKSSLQPVSVHLSEFPKATGSLIDEKLSASVRLAMKLSSLGRAARSKVGLKVRQPAEIALVTLKSIEENSLLGPIEAQIKDELNVKKVEISSDDKGVLDISLMPNLPILGKKYGAAVKDIRTNLALMDPFEVYGQVKKGEKVSIVGFLLEPEEIIVNIGERQGYSVSSDAGYAVAIKTDLTKKLIDEGIS